MKNFSKAVGIGLAIALVLLAVFAGAGAAALNTSFELSPDSELMIPGSNVSVKSSTTVNPANYSFGDGFGINSDLIWTNASYTISRNGEVLVTGDLSPSTKNYDHKFIDGIVIGTLSQESGNVTIKIEFAGEVPTNKSGSIEPMTVTSKIGSTTETITASGKLGKDFSVYKMADLNADLAKFDSDLQSLYNRIAVYKGYAPTGVGTPETKYAKAQEYSLTLASNISTENKSNILINYAIPTIESANNDLNNIGLQIADTYLKATSEIITSLKEMKRTDVAEKLEKEYLSLKSTYNNCKSAPSSETIDTLVRSTFYLDQDAVNAYEGKTLPEGLLSVLPYIIIGVVGAGVIAIVVFLIIRRRRNSWDELG